LRLRALLEAFFWREILALFFVHFFSICLGDFQPFGGFVWLDRAEWFTRFLAPNHGLLCPLNYTQLKLTRIGIAVERVPIWVRIV
jgi:hypothetical protein